jgi:transposase-like protein
MACRRNHCLGGFLDNPASYVLSALSDAERSHALARFHIIRPFLEEGVSLSRIAREEGILLRTAQRWVRRYRTAGLAGLARKARNDKDRPRISPSLQEVIEGLALQKPRPSIATVHRKAAEAAAKLGERPPSYGSSGWLGQSFERCPGASDVRIAGASPEALPQPPVRMVLVTGL